MTRQEQEQAINRTGVTYERDWDNDGYLRIENDKTIGRYKALKKEKQDVDLRKYNVFVAFNQETFDREMKRIKPLLEDGEKLVRIGGGVYGTREGYRRLTEYYDSVQEKIRQECDPWEIYLYEWNNFECCIAWDGDEDAIKEICRIWGDEVARSIPRLIQMYTIDEIKERQ
ncbi:MAG: hypothetical protein NC115_12010 [Bacteroidales bacterium]|nr:hypothetical protein [Bacteroidales bacterium]